MHDLLHLMGSLIMADTTAPIIKSIGNTISTLIFDNAKWLLLPMFMIGGLVWYLGAGDERIRATGRSIALTGLGGIILIYGVIGILVVNIINAISASGATAPTSFIPSVVIAAVAVVHSFI